MAMSVRWLVSWFVFSGISVLLGYLMPNTFIQIRRLLNKLPDFFFLWALLLILHCIVSLGGMTWDSADHCMLSLYCVPIFQRMNIRGAFFVCAFTIVVNSWKFSMLLLCILWDDWPIFRIPGSNQQLQQQLEYTLLKSWLSQLVNFKNPIWTWGHFRRTICNKIVF